MPNTKSIVMLVTQPATIEQAKAQGFVMFTFHPCLRDAEDAAINIRAITGRRAVTFAEDVKIGGVAITLYVLAETGRPKPRMLAPEYVPPTECSDERKARRSRFDAALNQKSCPPRTKVYPSAIAMCEHMSIEQGSTEGARILMHAAWHLENAKHVPMPAPVTYHAETFEQVRDRWSNPALNAFAVFMGEWAAKIRNVTR